MTDLQSLAKTVGKIPLKGECRRGGNGISYTDKEIETARFVCRLVLTLTEHPCEQPVTAEELQEEEGEIIAALFERENEISGGFQDVAQAIRRTYRSYELLMLSDEDTEKDFPKLDPHGERVQRSISSLTPLFRKALMELIPREQVETMFKMYHKERKVS